MLRSLFRRDIRTERWFCSSVQAAIEAADGKTITGKRGNDYMRPLRSVKDLSFNKAGDKIRVQGWVKGLRKQKKFVFFDVQDGLSHHKLPIVLPAEDKPKELNMHASVDVCGVLKESPNNPGLLELHPFSTKVLGGCDQVEYPLGGKTKYTAEHLRQYIHLRAKTAKFASVLRLRNAAIKAIHEFFDNNGFVQIHTPIVTGNDCEGAGEAFVIRPESERLIEEMISENTERDKNYRKSVKLNQDEIFFNKKVRLSVSGQLHLESAASGIGKVWTFSPAFRAENNKSTRHLSEFYMLETEIAFAYDIEDILEIMEDLVKSCIREVLHENVEDWKVVSEENMELQATLERILKHSFTVITFEEAKRMLKSKCNSEVVDGKGLSREQELLLTEEINNGIPVFVIDWPASCKPFYMRQCIFDSKKVSAVDLLVPSIGELCGGSLRENNYHLLEAAINRNDPTGALKESLSWYLELRKFGSVPSGGFGLGFDRLIQLVTGIKTIKDVSPFPRWTHHCPL